MFEREHSYSLLSNFDRKCALRVILYIVLRKHQHSQSSESCQSKKLWLRVQLSVAFCHPISKNKFFCFLSSSLKYFIVCDHIRRNKLISLRVRAIIFTQPLSSVGLNCCDKAANP